MSGGPDGCAVAFSDGSGFVVIFDSSVYRLTAVKKAAHKWGDRCHVLIEPLDSEKTKVTLKAKKLLENVEFLAGEFCNEVLDQELREVVAAETEGIRNLLMAEAFSKTSLIDQQFESADFHDDPAGITKPDVAHEGV